MGLSDLCLVNPQRYPDPEADVMAAGALDILQDARVVSSLDEAIADCSLVTGTSARSRNSTTSRPMLAARDCADELIRESASKPVALVFGQETMGLTNEELEKCHYHVCIEANPDYPVLNVASAIQILCYELRKSQLRQEQAGLQPRAEEYPLQEDLERFFVHLEQTLEDIDFIIKQHPGMVMKRLRRLFNRARPESKELNMLRGILASAQKSAKKT